MCTCKWTSCCGRCRKGAAQMVDQMGRLWPDRHNSPDFSLTAMHVCGQEASAQVPAAAAVVICLALCLLETQACA